jgi:hypothetical protein
MIKRLVLLSAAMLAVVLGATTHTWSTPGPALADTSTHGFDVQFCDVFTPPNGCTTVAGASLANGANPAYNVHIQLDRDGGVGEPFFDIATTTYTSNLVSSPNGGLTAPPKGAIVGAINFSIRSNTNPLLPGNIDPVTGAPPACGDAGTLTIAPATANTLAASTVIAPVPVMTDAGFDRTRYVQSFDDDDDDLVEFTAGVDGDDGGNTLPETQADRRDNAGALNPDGIPDGANLTPDFIPRLINALGVGSVYEARGFAIAQVVAGVQEVDVNFLLLDVTGLGGGYVNITTIGVIDPSTIYNPATAAQTTVTCAQFTSTTTSRGVAADNPASAANEGTACGGSPCPIRRLDSGLGGTTVDFYLGLSTAEDYDGSVTDVLDWCDASAVTNADADGDKVAGTCDNDPASGDNCKPATPCTTSGPADPDCIHAGGTGVVGYEGGSLSTDYPWTLDQDVDCDGAANFADNCPTVANGSAPALPHALTGAQRDADGDGVGDACDPKPALGNARSGVPKPVNSLPDGWITTNSDHDIVCLDAAVIGSGGEAFGGGFGPAGFTDMTCFTTSDASDDGTLDFNAGAPSGVPGGTGQRDSNSDSDFDGVSDGEESDGDGNCDGNVINADTDGDSTLDGAETGPAAVLCWIYDSNENSTTSLNPNANGSPDSDNDGCSNREEVTAGRNGLNPYDYSDLPGPATETGTDGKPYFRADATRGKSITLADASVALGYVGRTNVNAGAAYYNGDWNNDSMPDGFQIDRTAGGGAPNNAITLADVSIIIGQIAGSSCVSPP